MRRADSTACLDFGQDPWRPPMLLLAAACVTAACGGLSNEDRPDEASIGTGGSIGSGGDSKQFTFRRIVAGRDHFCGITQGDQRLVCIQNDQVISDEPGPFRAFDMNDDTGTSWAYSCAVKETGELSCWGSPELPIPLGEFTDVSVGAFNACARRASGGLECWVPETLGGLGTNFGAGNSYSVSQWSFCVQHDALNSQCIDRGGNELLPTDGSGHFAGGLYGSVVAAPQAGCAAILVAIPGLDYSDSPFEPFGEILGKDNIACFSAAGPRSKIEGQFYGFDVNVNEDGCALSDSSPGVVCWGAFERSVPNDLEGRFSDISVSTSLACVLSVAGSVKCWRPF